MTTRQRNSDCVMSLHSGGSNARHHPPRRDVELKQVLRMKATLFAVGCMPLLDGAMRLADSPAIRAFAAALRVEHRPATSWTLFRFPFRDIWTPPHFYVMHRHRLFPCIRFDAVEQPSILRKQSIRALLLYVLYGSKSDTATSIALPRLIDLPHKNHLAI